MLRVVDPAAPSSVPFSPRDIVLFKGSTPNDLTHVAGIITEVPQTPLSHINLKAKQDKVPNAFIKGALQDPNVKSLVGKLVKYEVTANGYTLTAATPAEVEAYDKKVRPTSAQIPKPDLSELRVKSFADLGIKDAKAFGGKTTNLAEMRKVLPQSQTPDGFGIPFSFYDDFMKSSGLYDKAQKMAADPKFKSDVAYRDEALKDFRKLLKKTPVPTALVAQLDQVQKDMLAKLPAGASLRLRSSTNNEDLEGFNGAGLYDSYTVRPKDKESVADEIKKVWASVWNFRAFEEREFWKIPHDKAMMAVTVHGNVDGELANGVAVTKNIYDENWPGFYVNSQVGENLVTNPDPKSVPEEMLVSAIGEHNEYEVQRIRKSSMLGGKPVLNAAQIKELVLGLEKIQAHFKKKLHKENDKGFAMDVEWKVLPDGHIYIKQARPLVG
jgi:phosphoenolpyruvate synthase/pyruvate phosphate dikinase